MSKKVTVTRESETGRNERFQIGSREVSRAQFVREIKDGEHPDYHVRNINGIDTPVSNPDGKERNNLG
jgi:hypothetical protein